MGIMTSVMGFLFGDGRNLVAETAEVFRVHADKADARDADIASATLKQFGAEFGHNRTTLFDRVIDGVNRLPRPMLALGTIALFIAAMSDPIWFAERMTGVALVPEPLWWLMGAIVSFYFGARHQAKGQEFQRAVAQTVALGAALRPKEPKAAVLPDQSQFPDNAALADWAANR